MARHPQWRTLRSYRLGDRPLASGPSVAVVSGQRGFLEAFGLAGVWSRSVTRPAKGWPYVVPAVASER
jgi:hypothetical protein